MAKAKKVVDNGVVVSRETCVTSSSMVISLECVSPSAARDISLHNQRFTDVKVGFKTLPTSRPEQKPKGRSTKSRALLLYHLTPNARFADPMFLPFSHETTGRSRGDATMHTKMSLVIATQNPYWFLKKPDGFVHSQFGVCEFPNKRTTPLA